MKNYYNILEVEPNATPEHIKSQYHILLHAWHPDKFPSGDLKNKAEEKIKDVNEAYDVLSNPAKRESYDKAFHSNSPPPPATQQSYSQPPQSQSDAQPKQDNDRNAKGEPQNLPSVFNRALLLGLGIGLILFVYNLQISGSFNVAFYRGISSVIIYGFLYSAIVWLWRVVIKKTVKEPFSSDAGCISIIAFLVLFILHFLYISGALILPYNGQISSLEIKPTISTLVPSTTISTPQNTPTLSPPFQDTFSDNRNQWGLDNVVKIEGGILMFQNVPAYLFYWTSCAYCTINPSQNQVTVDVIPEEEDSGLGSPTRPAHFVGPSPSRNTKGIGLVIDNELCNPSQIIFQVDDNSRAYNVSRYVQETANNGYWEPIEVYGARRNASSWIFNSGIINGQVNKLSAVYGFSKDSLKVYLYINNEYVTWFQVPDYNKSLQCSVGLLVDDSGGMFDNFVVSTKEVPTTFLPTLKIVPTAEYYYDYSLCEEIWVTTRDGREEPRMKCPSGYPTP